MSENDVQISYGDGFEALLEVLAGARRPGSWYASGALETPMPAVEIAGIGMLSFPVPPAQARQLIENAAERAPYGRGDQTLLDDNVRKVWQIGVDKVKISGKGWSSTFGQLLRKIGENLGCEGITVEAQFYKMLVYEKGSFFLSHRDTEKTAGMFGTLVVALPSTHEGGELVVRHADRETVIDLRGNAPSEIQFAAFYADCEHEVKPLLAGFRVCIIYNLIQRKKKKPLTPPDHRNAIAKAAPLLSRWASSGELPDKIVYLLEHHYTEATLSFSALKGADAALSQVLVPAAAQAGCAAHLGIVHIEESGWAEHTGGGYYGRRYGRSRWDDYDEEDEEFDMGEVYDGSYYIDQWRTADDSSIDFGQIPIGDGEVLPPGALDGESPDESHFSEATGNEGASFERTYLRATLVIWPEDRFDRICASAGPDAALARLEQLVAAAKKSSGAKREAAQDAVRRMARILPPLAHRSFEKERVSRLLEVLLRFSDADLLVEVAGPRLLDLYDGSQNRALLAVIPLLGEKQASALLAAVVRARGPFLSDAVIELWTSLAKKHAKHRELLDSTLDALFEAIAQYTTPERPAWARGSRYRDLDLNEIEEIPGFRPLAPATVSAFLTSLHGSQCTSRMHEAIRKITEKPDLFTPENVLLPALEKLAIPADDGPAEIWAHCARHYLHRSENPPEPPKDWAQDVSLSGKSPLIRELEAFARDPQAQVHRFRVRKELRQQVHRAIEYANLDMTHVTERRGSPQTLVCTKTRTSYERACKQYQTDLSDMRRLLALPFAQTEVNSLLTQRLNYATGAK